MKSIVIQPVVRMVLRILSIILFMITALSAYGGRIDPSISALPGIAVMVMPYLVVASMVVIILWLVGRRWITAGIGVACLAAAWGPISSAVPFRFPRNPKADKETFTLMTWNFLHGEDQNMPREKQQGNEALDFIISSKADIVCLQEMVDWDSEEVPNLNDFDAKVREAYPYMAWQQKNDNRILSKFPVRNIPTTEIARRIGYVPDQSIESYGSELRHFSFYEVKIGKRKLLVVNVHFMSPGLSPEERELVTDIKGVDSAKESAREFKNSVLGKIQGSLVQHKRDANALVKFIGDYDGPVIICGDLNDVTESYAWRVFRKAGFSDAYSETGFGPIITYNRHLFWFHLDHILYRGPVRPLSVRKKGIDTSDHFPLISTFQLD